MLKGWGVQWHDMRGEWGHSALLTEAGARARYAEEAHIDSGNRDVYLLEYVEHSKYPIKREEWHINAEQQGS